MKEKLSVNAQRMLRILDEHAYTFDHPRYGSSRIALQTPTELLRSAEVYTPQDVARLREHFTAREVVYSLSRLGVWFTKSSASQHLHTINACASHSNSIHDADTLILNFASTRQPGGRIRSGGHGQEESLCEDSTLLASLESENAAAFYRIQGACASALHTDAMILSPFVEFFASDGDLLAPARVAAVLSAAPPRSDGDQAALEEALYQRIRGMLFVAAHEGYEHLILGAWGCGSGGNDPELVAALFERALREPLTVATAQGQSYCCNWKDFFHSVTMAVPQGKNCAAFERRFADFYRAEREEKHQKIRNEIAHDREKHLSAIKGSLLGGAIGDALGYPVEFMTHAAITARYGEGGIHAYEKDGKTGLALISDDTQMTLFTATGMLVYDTRGAMHGIAGAPQSYIHHAYRDWYVCQCAADGSKADCAWMEHGHTNTSWLSYLSEMRKRRAPGNTCMSALHAGGYGTIEEPINRSKGCGGVMRIAPVALYYQNPHQLSDVCLTAARAAALTHGHPLGYMPAAALAFIISRAAFGGCPYEGGLHGILKECREMMASLFSGEPHLSAMLDLMERAEALAADDQPNAQSIESLGGGWVAEEALAIALYCCLKYPDDFSGAVIAAVNHGGDSDSTGAITGNIMGAWLGIEKIDPKWLQDLELKSVIEEVATDLCDHCRMSEYSDYRDEDWERKYIHFGHSQQEPWG
ncbi:MAG: TIGR02452 family protein [Clostridia bacterium]|nr:TIGR02452 family protein [Clostridia bacterium]